MARREMKWSMTDLSSDPSPSPPSNGNIHSMSFPLNDLCPFSKGAHRLGWESKPLTISPVFCEAPMPVGLYARRVVGEDRVNQFRCFGQLNLHLPRPAHH